MSILLMLASITPVFSVNMARAYGNALLALSPSKTSIPAGKEFTVAVNFNPNGETIDTVRLNVTFPSQVLRVERFSFGSLFPNSSPGNVIDNQAGFLSQGAFSSTGVNQGGLYGTITFKALYGGTANISLISNSKAINNGEEKINQSSFHTVTLTLSGTPPPNTPPVSPVSSKPTTAEDYFKKLAGRSVTNSAEDQRALDCISTDSCYNANNRNLSFEQQAVTHFIT
ncbi:MAG TPA: cohesin domain-containing protein, partial [Patescibacteria group bacterium]|nr:cohesin domain-containing protein [Patescibacteria group bacterium]